MYAIIGEHELAARLLLEKESNLNVQSKEYASSLVLALVNGNVKIITLLLDKRSDVMRQGRAYRNALEAASENGYQKVI
ncbi:hypothetical protein MMC07_001974 [Pseudocyphellaria aurata]|nr:hypothetical protein [Pseudocyphellaria aurata]